MKVTNIHKTQIRVSDFINWQKNSNLELSPSFQRRSVWKPGAKSYLLDTIIRGLPIPIIILRDRRTDLKTLEATREVVDGQQRIRTLISFIAPGYLKNYNPKRDYFQIIPSHNKAYSRKNFSELPGDIRQKILDYEFSVHILPVDVGDREVLEIFSRINASGVTLNSQELRNAEYYGELKTSVYESAYKQLSRWRAWGIFTEADIARMQEVELTSDLYYMMTNGISSRTKKTLDDMYEEYDEHFVFRKQIEFRFEKIMDTIDDFLGKNMKSLHFSRKTFFYILFAIIYEQSFGIGSKLVSMKPKKITSSQINNLLSVDYNFKTNKVNKKYLDATTRRTTNLKERTLLYDYIKKSI